MLEWSTPVVGLDVDAAGQVRVTARAKIFIRAIKANEKEVLNRNTRGRWESISTRWVWLYRGAVLLALESTALLVSHREG